MQREALTTIFKERLLKGEELIKRKVCSELNIDERTFRYNMSIVAKELPIIALSHNRGYRLAINLDDLEDARHQLAELCSRQQKLEDRKTPLVKWLNKYEKLERQH